MTDDIYNNENKKKIVFNDTVRRHAELKIKLKYDNLSQQNFWDICVDAYLTDNPNMRSVIEEKQKGKTIKEQREKEIKKSKETKMKFGLDEMEQESIFDLIETFNPDL